jgi:anti-anti-sigma regulatory factor
VARSELEQVYRGLDPAELERVTVDIREVTFFDTTGLNLAHRLDRWGKEHGVAVLFTRAIPEVTRGLRAAGLTLTLTFSDAPEDQLALPD